MARRKRVLELTAVERATLEAARASHPKPYVRERAAALLQIADGTAAYAVARAGILRPRHPETLYLWLNGFQRKGIVALFQLPRRARGQDFSPSQSRTVHRTAV